MSLEVVIVDDDKIIIYLHKITLAKCGLSANPLIYHSGKELLYFLNREHDAEKKYLIFLDTAMPEMSGWDILEEIKNKSLKDRLFVILVNSSISTFDATRARSFSNVIGVYEKPLDMDCCNSIKFLPSIAHFFNDSIK